MEKEGYKLFMKIMQIMPEFGVAGAERMCECLTYELIEMGHEVVVVSLFDYHSAITDKFENNNVKVIYLDKRRGLDFSIIIKLIKLFKNEKPDVIHTHRNVMEYAIPAALVTGVKKRVHTIHSIAKMENIYLARKLNKFFYKRLGVIPVALSAEVKKTIIAEYGLDESQIPIVYNGIDLSKCSPKTSYATDKTLSILHVGRFSEEKNHEGLLRAFSIYVSKHPDAVLTLLGDGKTKESMVALTKELMLQGNVHFEGIRDNVYDYLKKADIFILPSIYEGIPMTLIEAMGMGLPIVASAVGGVPDMIENEKEGLLIDGSIDSIVKALERFAEDELLRGKCGESALMKSSTFSSKKMAEKYETIYRDTT